MSVMHLVCLVFGVGPREQVKLPNLVHSVSLALTSQCLLSELITHSFLKHLLHLAGSPPSLPGGEAVKDAGARTEKPVLAVVLASQPALVSTQHSSLLICACCQPL